MPASCPQKKKQNPSLLSMMVGALLLLPMIAVGNRNSAVWADETRPARAETQVQVGTSPADCTQKRYRQEKNLTSTEGKEITFSLPPNSDGPVLVDLGLYIIAITDINITDNTFHMEGFLDLIWCDPRLAYSVSDVGQQGEIFLEETALEKLRKMWWPDILFVNEVGGSRIENVELNILPDGTINHQHRFNVELKTNYDLRQFPFDRQLLEIEIESFSWSNDHLVFHQKEDVVGFSTEFEIPEWEIVQVKTHIEEKQEVHDRKPFSEFSMTIEVARLSSYYQWKILLPLIVLVAISWSVFWMIGDGLANRMSVSLTGILTIVAYQFVVSDGLPKVSYFTLMDSILTLSFIMMALTIMQNIYVNSLYLQERKNAATKWDKRSRWLFPLGYFGGLLILFTMYLLY